MDGGEGGSTSPAMLIGEPVWLDCHAHDAEVKRRVWRRAAGGGQCGRRLDGGVRAHIIRILLLRLAVGEVGLLAFV